MKIDDTFANSIFDWILVKESNLVENIYVCDIFKRKFVVYHRFLNSGSKFFMPSVGRYFDSVLELDTFLADCFTYEELKQAKRKAVEIYRFKETKHQRPYCPLRAQPSAEYPSELDLLIDEITNNMEG
jgi:hypothetical protein